LVRKGDPLRQHHDKSRLAGFGSGWLRLREMDERACGQEPSATRVPPRWVGVRHLVLVALMVVALVD
jgi:hypothetical protein